MNGRLGKHQFARLHGLGNDYLVVDGAAFGLPLEEAVVRRICDRHTGVGSDGILEMVIAPPGFDAAVRIYNPDGSEAEKSGNGVRIFSSFCIDHGYVAGRTELRVHTRGGTVTAHRLARGPLGSLLRISMGTVSFRAADLPMNADGEWVDRPLEVGGRSLRATCLSIGNPHAVLLDAPFDEQALLEIGPQVERHPLFPRRTNVQLVQIVDRQRVRALIWERGAGRTASSGSSACAVAAACVRAGLIDPDVQVVMPGGTLEVSVHPDFSIDQTGPVQELAIGTLSDDLVAELSAPSASGDRR